MTINIPTITSWKTTVLGLLSAFVAAMQTYNDGSITAGIQDPKVQMALLVALIGILSKDYNVTGGTVAATPEAATRVAEVPPVPPAPK